MGYAVFWLIIAIFAFAIVSIISLSIGYPWLKKKYKNMHKNTHLGSRETCFSSFNYYMKKVILEILILWKSIYYKETRLTDLR